MNDNDAFDIFLRKMNVIQHFSQYYFLKELAELVWFETRPRGYKTFFMLNSTEHDFSCS